MNNRILWDCRRGMLELDIVLARFMEQRFDGLTAQEIEAFGRLLACSDPDLWALIQGSKSRENDHEMAQMINLLRQC
ncbi:MAG: succinate dehydrogenase assembly factor 2 [Betaproteobacteria bacterium]|nr:succinate dehydrogenase assembly factor 2 [Betaproteobacteria bacterium]